MFTNFTKEEKAIHYPEERRIVIITKRYMLVILPIIAFVPIMAAWLQYLFFGLPLDPGLACHNSY